MRFAANVVAIFSISLLAVLGCNSSTTGGGGNSVGVAVTVNVHSDTAYVGDAPRTYTAQVTGTTDTAVSWSVQETSGCGNVDPTTGRYTLPAAAGTCHVIATSHADSSKSDKVTVTILEKSQSKIARVGGHLPEISSWTAPIYADFLKQSLPWKDSGTGQDLEGSQLDDNGWPTVDAAIIFSVGSPAPSAVIVGTHELSFNGRADVSAGEQQSIQNLVYDQATNTTTAEVVIANAGSNCLLKFDNTWRKGDHSPDATGNVRGITNVRLIAAGHTAEEYWRKEVASMCQIFSVIRFSTAQGPGDGTYSANGGLTGIMGSGETTWGSRTRPNFLGYTAKGIPWEDIVIFANMLKVDVWAHIPIGANNDYITKVFQLLKYGSDGNVPFTQQTNDPSSWQFGNSWYPGLLPGRHVYIEFTNELFSYYQYGDPQGRAEIANNDPHHLMDTCGSPDQYASSDCSNPQSDACLPGDCWGAWNAVRISQLAREVWGDAMQDTIRIVYANQGDWGGFSRHRRGLKYIDTVWGPNSKYGDIDGIKNAKMPVSYYLHNISGSFYLHACMNGENPTTTSVTELFSEIKTSLSEDGGLSSCTNESNSVYERHLAGQQAAQEYGIKLTSYETGSEIFRYGSVGDAWSDPRMEVVYHNLLAHLLSMQEADVAVESATVRGVFPGNELSMSYSAADGFPWPLSGNPAPSQAWQAVMNVAAGQLQLEDLNP